MFFKIVNIKTHLLLLLLSISFNSCRDFGAIEKAKGNFILDDGIYIEKSLTDSSQNRYTIDNKIYTPNRKYIFDYYILKNEDTLKIIVSQMPSPDDDFDRTWEFIKNDIKHQDQIETISITVQNGIYDKYETMLKYEYQYSTDLGYSSFSSTSGVIENEINTWIHPQRDKYFMILELNPFPYIQQPFRTGNKWTWCLIIGDHWKDNRWKLWEGRIKNNYEYEIIGKENLKTSIGELDCWIVQGIAVSEIGATGLIAYFSEEYGFVKLDYVNIDQSKLVIEIKEIR